MARFARVVVPGIPYHITHRGNLCSEVFFCDIGRHAYLNLLKICCERFELDIWAYCLMTNHFHMLAVGRHKDSLSRALGLAHQRYSSMINAQRGGTGHLWANRFFSTPLDEGHLWNAVRYVELNPVRASVVSQAEQWPWSSAGVQIGFCCNPTPGCDREKKQRGQRDDMVTV